MSKKQSISENGELTQALEMYVKTIHDLEEEFGAAAPSDIAKTLAVKAPSVTSALQKLDSLGMAEYQRYQHVNLTEKGRKVAEMLDRRHRTIREFLLLIGVDEEIALSDACEIEHIVHKETIDKLAQFMKKSGKQ
ncbi:MAG: metal-dependent transcriptional regulator [Candidatus Thorarchaeota archaeon]|nr:MAG: metal-dependent transcriptional regulator [Candidatus Thorarchaeota archaeon]